MNYFYKIIIFAMQKEGYDAILCTEVYPVLWDNAPTIFLPCGQSRRKTDASHYPISIKLMY